MPDIKDIVDRVARAFGPDADPARVEAVVSSLLDAKEPAFVLSGARLHVSLTDSSSLLTKTVRSRAYDKIRRIASHVESALREAGLGGTLHIASSPLTQIAGRSMASDMVVLARMLDDAARDCSASEITGMTAVTEHGIGAADAALLSAIPEVLHATSRVVVDVRAASPGSGVNVDAVMNVVSALRRFNRASEDLLRLRLTGSAARPHAADAALCLTANGSALIDEALHAAPDAPIQDVADVLTATAFSLGRGAAQQGDAAAAVLRARSGLDVQFGGIEIDPGTASRTDGIVRAAFAQAIAAGFRAAVRRADVLPFRVAAAFQDSITDGAVGAWLAARLVYGGRPAIAVHAVFSDRNADERLRIGPFHDVRVREPQEPEWVRRGGRIPALWSGGA